MCSNERATVPGAAMLPYPLAALKQLNEATPGSNPTASATSGLLPLDHYRLQLYNYAMAERLRFTGQLYPAPLPLTCPPPYAPYSPRLHAFSMSLFHHRALQPEEPKPQHSYIGLIAMAILSSPDTKLVLSDIYQYILDNYPYFRSRGPGWRNSIRHNLSLNDCFVKAGRSANGKGHYWAIHPANVEDFKKGDFRRRKAQRKVRKHMGLAVDEEGGDSPSPPPVSASPPMSVPTAMMPSLPALCWGPAASPTTSLFPPLGCGIARKRQFDVASLLAPDEEDGARKQPRRLPCGLLPVSSGEEDNVDEDIDVVTSEDHVPLNDSIDESARESPPCAGRVSSQRHSPALLTTWSPQAASMFPAAGLEQQLVARYYEQLAAAQQQQQRRFLLQQQQQGLCPAVVALSSDNDNNPSDKDDVR